MSKSHPVAVTALLSATLALAGQPEAPGYAVEARGDGTLWARNAAQQWDTTFDAGGLRVASGDGGWSWTLSIEAWGRPGALVPVAPAAPVADGPRVQYARGPLTEWLENRPDGLEHGFTIQSPPAATGEWIAVDLRLGGALRPVFAADGQAVDFHGPRGLSVLRYAKLVVTDAGGVRLPARLQPIPGGIRIAARDAGAVYPVTVDPLATSSSWTITGDNLASLGTSVATAGDVNGDGYADVIVGAPMHGAGNGLDTGRAYVHHGSPSGPTATASWVVTGDEVGARHGGSVGTAGDVNGDGYADVVVGAPGHEAGGGPGDRGRAYLHLGSAAGLQASASWTASGDHQSATFGGSVATAGDVNGDGHSDVIVGAAGHPGGGVSRGRAYVYLGSTLGLEPSPAWTVSGDEDFAWFGTSVQTAGDVNGDGYSDVIVGAYRHDGGGGAGADRGRAYLYLGSAAGLSASPAWTATGDENGSNLGYSVGAAGDVNGDGFSDAIVGAPWHDAGGVVGADRGRVHVFLGSVAGLMTSPSWSVSGDEDDAHLGDAAGTLGDGNGDGYADVVLGARLHDAGASAGADRGRAYVYLGSPAGLAAPAAWIGSGDEDDASLGDAVGTAGDANGDGFSDLAVGAPGHDGGGGFNANRGRAYAFLGSAGGLAASPAWTGSGDENLAYLGSSLLTAGDVDGDGFADVIVGAFGHDAGGGAGANRGRAYVHLGAAGGLTATAAWRVSGDENGAAFGLAVGSAGDVNGDGYGDVIVGAPSHDAGAAVGANRGRAYLYLGSAAGLSVNPAWTASGDEDGASFGVSAGTAGDVNGDGHGDVIVGAPYHDAGAAVGANRGRAYLFLGTPGGLAASPAWVASGDEDGASLGYSLGTTGDVDGDGRSDAIVGTPGHDAGAGPGAQRGRAYVHLGTSSGLSTAPVWTVSGDEDGASLGYSVGTAGDVNGDAYADVVVGAYLHNVGEGPGSHRGRAYVYLGTSAGLLPAPAWTASGDENGANFGNAVGTAGDVNGDGYSDVLVGASGHDAGAGPNRGRAYVYLGSAGGLTASPSWTGSGDENAAFFGGSVGTAGDVDGDGFADALVGAYQHDAGAGALANRGRAYLHPGNDGVGALRQPRQRRSDLSAPIAPLGLAHEQRFRIGLWLRSPGGRGAVKLEWQAVPLRGSLHPLLNPIQASAFWLDAGVTGVSVNQLVDLGAYQGPWTWRARARYHPTASPFLRHGPWMTPAANGQRETDVTSSTQAPPPPCTPPDEAVLIAGVTLNPQSMPVLHIQDPNQPSSVTGYNIYRATSPAGPFTLVASDVVDMDAGTPDVQWVDQNGVVGGPYYYQARAYNHACLAEGP